MKLESRISYIAFIVLGIIFILVGQALNELDLIETVNANSSREGGLSEWYEFLKPFIGDQQSGLPPPWNP